MLNFSAAAFFVEEPQDVELGVGGDAEFSCSADGVPPPDIEWFINGESLESRPSYKTVLLVMYRMTIKKKKRETWPYIFFHWLKYNSYNFKTALIRVFFFFFYLACLN